jgi:RHS repeat-associated protein
VLVGSYQYDAMTRRITRSVGGTVWHTYYSKQWKPIEERKNAETTANIHHLWGARHRDDLARRDRVTSGTVFNETRYVMMDYFNPMAIVDQTGAVKERYAFSAFGKRRILAPDWSSRTTSECGMEFAFQGQFLDSESGLMNYGFRYLSPELGRWTCKDPIEERGGLNQYCLVENTVTNSVDHLGLFPQSFLDDWRTNFAEANLYAATVGYDMVMNNIPPQCFKDGADTLSRDIGFFAGLRDKANAEGRIEDASVYDQSLKLKLEELGILKDADISDCVNKCINEWAKENPITQGSSAVNLCDQLWNHPVGSTAAIGAKAAITTTLEGKLAGSLGVSHAAVSGTTIGAATVGVMVATAKHSRALQDCACECRGEKLKGGLK